MQLSDLYNRHTGGVAEFCCQVHLYGQDPAAMLDLKSLESADRRAADDIRRLESYAEALKLYRAAIAQRYQELATAPTVPVITLKRSTKTSYSGIQYTLAEYRQYLDGTRAELRHTTYSGKERHKAIADFNAAVKAHPGITAEMDIAKGRWER